MASIPPTTGRPGYHPSVHLKLYVYGYLNRVHSSRRLEREAGRNLEVMWLLQRLAPDYKTIADFRKDNGPAIKKVCAQFIELCRKIGFAREGQRRHRRLANSRRSTTATRTSRKRKSSGGGSNWRRALRVISRSSIRPICRRAAPAITLKRIRLKDKLEKLHSEMAKLEAIEKQMLASPDEQISLTDPDSRSMATSGRGSGVVGYNVQTAVETEHHLIVAP